MESAPQHLADLMPIPAFLELVNREHQNISREGFYSALKNGSLPCYRFNRKILVDPSEILNAMRRGGSLAGPGGNETQNP